MTTVPLLRLRMTGLAAAILAIVIAGLVSGAPVGAQTPPGPVSRFPASPFAIVAAPAQYEVYQTVLEFRPGAKTREHTHGGPEFVTVVEGQLTRIKDGVETLFLPGQTFREEQGTFFTVANMGTLTARAFATILLSPGQPVTLNHPDRPVPGQVPTAVSVSRTTVGTQPAEFSLIQQIIDFAPGAYAPRHRHNGVVLISQLSGTILTRVGDAEIRQTAGGTYLENEGIAANHRNVGQETATVVVTFLVPRGRPPATAEASAPVAQAIVPQILPPRTGDGGLR